MKDTLGIGFMIAFVVGIVLTAIIVDYTSDTAASLDTTIASEFETVFSAINIVNTLQETPSGNIVINAVNQSWINFGGNGGGNTDKINISNSPIPNGDNNFTISAWVMFSSNDGLGGKSQIITIGNNTAANGNRIYFQVIGGNLSFNFRGINTVTGTSINNSQWRHVVVRYNGTHTQLFIDSVGNRLAATNANNSISNGITNIGMIDNSTTGVFTGGIDEIRVYNSSLVKAEIDSIFAAGRYKNDSLVPNNLRLYLSLNEDTTHLLSGSTAYDTSNQGNNATLLPSGTEIAFSYLDDGANQTLNSGDYNITGDQFIILNSRYGWTPLLTSYDFTTETPSDSGIIIRLISIFSVIALLAYAFKKINDDLEIF